MTKTIITSVVLVAAIIILLPNLCLKAYGWVLFGLRKAASWLATAIVWAWTQPASYCWKYIAITWGLIKAFDAKFKTTADKAETKEEAVNKAA